MISCDAMIFAAAQTIFAAAQAIFCQLGFLVFVLEVYLC